MVVPLTETIACAALSWELNLLKTILRITNIYCLKCLKIKLILKNQVELGSSYKAIKKMMFYLLFSQRPCNSGETCFNRDVLMALCWKEGAILKSGKYAKCWRNFYFFITKVNF